jgi:riboflavin kinase/FMN adenylyltransferase
MYPMYEQSEGAAMARLERFPTIEADVRRLLSADAVPCVVSVGTFDGVHRAHQALLRTAADAARTQALECVAVTFSPRPDVVRARGHALPDICPLEERIRRLRRAGADRVVVVPFSLELAAVPYDVFAEMLTDCLQMRTLYVGADFAFGAGRAGTPSRLREIGIDVRTHPLVMADDGDDKVSSSSIRRLISLGLDGYGPSETSPMASFNHEFVPPMQRAGATADPGR